MADQQTRNPSGPSRTGQKERLTEKADQAQGTAKNMNPEEKQSQTTGKQQAEKSKDDSGCCGCG